ncbi:MAG: EamA family transporter [Chloroflexota bacterium]|nr:EamA family transporter [Chloroflexota bacterium]
MLNASTIWSWAIEQRGVGRTVPYLFLVPIETGVLAALLPRERFGLIKLAGALLILLGTALVRLVDRASAAGA